MMKRDRLSLRVPHEITYGKPDPSVSTNTRLGYGLQRRYQPVSDGQPGRLGYLMKLLDQRLSS
jgi:hypothetical protein